MPLVVVPQGGSIAPDICEIGREDRLVERLADPGPALARFRSDLAETLDLLDHLLVHED